MCGITGALWTDPAKAIEIDRLRKMTNVLAHRGPDDSGLLHSNLQQCSPYPTIPGIALGHRRLSIIDIAGGHQPMCNEDETVWVVFNGEIYNFQALRSRLEGAGHTFRTQSDTETLVHLYEDEGADCFKHLNGMFSIAIWDSRNRRLVLGRDRLGQKPLYYYHEPGRLIFGSELKAILQVPEVPREVDPNAIDEYLTYQYVPHPNTIFKQIKKLSPGHSLVIENDTLTNQAYWTPNFREENTLSKQENQTQLKELFRDSVKLRMQSEVPLGAFLSGGVDSSLVVATMCELTDQKVQTFSIGFPQAEYDETSYARLVADHLGTEHHEFQVTPDAVDILPKLVWQYDEPMADSSAIPTWYVAQYTREAVTVALSGDGGDELFAGYDRYKAVRLGSWLDRLGPIKQLVASPLWQKLPSSNRQKSFMRRLKRFSEAAAMPAPRRYLEWISIFNETRRAELYTDEFVEQLSSDPFDFLKAAWKKSDNRDPITSASLADLTTYLPCDLNTKVDIASMAHSLECRQPFLDHQLVEFAISMPHHLKWRRGKGKRILHDTFADKLPAEIWNRKKMGFGVPLDHWFRNELREMVHDVLLDQKTLQRGYFREESIRSLVHEHTSGMFDHSARLWALLVLELWLRRWVDSEASS
ncbi:MAG: asparagine synthase (glutamine-hydrolyzing) [Blastopirellula sp.]|nr:MAG: asparagine synthase (glutamine-hydrolyzing) [Blastopirellula sp.]